MFYQARGKPSLVAADVKARFLLLAAGDNEELKANIADVVLTYLATLPDSPPVEVNINGNANPAQLIISVVPLQGFLG